MAAVSGSALITGCTKSGNLCAEKNTPETIHIGIITEFISPEAASMVRARDAISNPKALNDSEAKHAQQRQIQQAIRGSGTPKASAPKPSTTPTSTTSITSRESRNDSRK